MDIKGTSFIKESTTLENKVYQGKVNTLLKGYILLLRENGSYMVINDSIKIINTFYNDELIYPNYTLDDIKIKRWDGGKHYYAKIGNMEVVIDGINKWNTPQRAREMAEQFFKTI